MHVCCRQSSFSGHNIDLVPAKPEAIFWCYIYLSYSSYQRFQKMFVNASKGAQFPAAFSCITNEAMQLSNLRGTTAVNWRGGGLSPYGTPTSPKHAFDLLVNCMISSVAALYHTSVNFVAEYISMLLQLVAWYQSSRAVISVAALVQRCDNH